MISYLCHFVSKELCGTVDIESFEKEIVDSFVAKYMDLVSRLSSSFKGLKNIAETYPDTLKIINSYNQHLLIKREE